MRDLASVGLTTAYAAFAGLGDADRTDRPSRHVARATACNSVDGLSWIGSVK